MKYLYTLIIVVVSTTLFAQTEIRNADGSYFKQCSHFEISKPLWQLAKEHPSDLNKVYGHREAKDRERKNIHPVQNPETAPSIADDPIVQREQGDVSTMGTIVNVDGMPNVQGFDPLDPNGMVGPNYYVQAINSNYQVFNKNGTAATAAIDLATLFPGSLDDGDPVVMYDRFADRWVITEFLCPGGGNCTKLLFAVSKTNDPTGAYYLYTFEPDASDYADYPKYSIWSDGYYETCNCSNPKVTIYERAKMLLGDPTAGFIVVPSTGSPNPNAGFFCPQTLYADGQLPPYGSPQYYFYFTDDNWGSQFKDMIFIYKITSNWTSKTGTFTKFDSLATLPFNSYFTGGTEQDISQPGTSNKIDALDGFFSYRIPYLRWTNYNIALMCHPVNTGTSSIVAGIRWYELHQDTVTTKWNIYQQGTYSPADGVSRWNPAIAMDINGNIGLAYSVSSPTSVYPGTRFTGRTSCDTLGKMTVTETTAIAGSSSWTSDNRWGDYSHLSVDPSDGISFWHTNQYIGASSTIHTRIFSFQIPKCTGAGVANIQTSAPMLVAFQSGNELNIKATNLPSDEKSVIDFFNTEGKMIARKSVSPFSNAVETTINVSGIARGIYYVRIGNTNFQRVIKVSVQ